MPETGGESGVSLRILLRAVRGMRRTAGREEGRMVMIPYPFRRDVCRRRVGRGAGEDSAAAHGLCAYIQRLCIEEKTCTECGKQS
ncbi:MAG: hypothetical protein J6K32_07950 [Clostridia bacterium]|nr:hypothetical protein [Clostridia bacterium]